MFEQHRQLWMERIVASKDVADGAFPYEKTASKRLLSHWNIKTDKIYQPRAVLNHL